MNWQLTVATGTLGVLLACVVLAQEKKPAAAAVEQEMQPAAKATGYFEPVGAAELAAGTEQITSLVIKQIVAHGSQVKQGQALVWFKTDDDDKQVATVSTSSSTLEQEDDPWADEETPEEATGPTLDPPGEFVIKCCCVKPPLRCCCDFPI